MGAVPGASGFGTNDLDALARQYWSAWGEQLRAAGAPAQPAAAPGWNEAVAWWSQLARGERTDTNDVLDRFNTQARGWFAQMQQLATQFAGQNTSAADIAGVWKQTLGDNPFAPVLNGMQGPGLHGVEQWMEQVAPFLQMWQQSGKGLLGLPAFGFSREHQERWQKMAQAQVDFQEHSKAYQALMAEAGKKAFERFETKLAEHSEPGRQLGSARALFDLWVDAAEEAYAEIALSPKFREVYGEYVNSQMRVRAAVQQEVEEMCGLFGIPGRTEVDGAHRKIVQLERELRRLRDAVERNVAPKAAGLHKSARATETRETPSAAPEPTPAKPAVTKRAPAKRASTTLASTAQAAAATEHKPAAKPSKAAAAKSPVTGRASAATAKRKR
ncbi:MAG: class III poly(R)-hydroxyalkanoic acid synthase subunit PhaE [Lysobacter sp.]